MVMIYVDKLPPAADLLQWVVPRDKLTLGFKRRTRSVVPVARLYRARDYLQDGLHFAVGAGLAVAAGIWAGPVIFACCAAGAGVLTLGSFALADKIMPKMFTRRKIALGQQAGLGQIMRDFTRRAGLRRKPVLYDFELNRKEVAKQKDGALTAPPQLKRVVNAAAVGLRKPVVILSEPLLQLMQPPETRAVVAHEFTHLGARHTTLRLIAGWLQTTTMLTAMFGRGSVVVGQGWLTGVLSIAGTVGIAYLGNKLMPRQEDRYTRDGTLRPGMQRTQFAVTAAQEILSVGLLAIPNPAAVLTAVAIEHGFFWSANFVMKSLSRRQEFQADRGAVAMGADPLALVTSLRKLEAVLKRDEPGLSNAMNWRQGAWPVRALKLVESLFRSHPDTGRRCQRLAGMAATQGRSPAEIDAALTGPIDISVLPPKPAEGEEHSVQASQLTAMASGTGLWSGLITKNTAMFGAAKQEAPKDASRFDPRAPAPLAARPGRPQAGKAAAAQRAYAIAAGNSIQPA